MTSQGSVLTEKKSFFFGIFYSSFKLRLKNIETNKKINYTISSSNNIQVFTIEPGEYIVIGISDTVYTLHSSGRISATKEFGDIPEELMQLIHIGVGEIVYLGVFSTRSSSAFTIKQDIFYAHDFEKAKNMLLQSYTIPEGMIIKDFIE